MYELRSGAFLTPHGRQVTMEYRDGTNDYNTLNSSLNQDEYKLPEGLVGTALDIGGYLGSVGIALALDNPDLSVVIVEPVPPNCELIRQNIHLNNVGDRVSLIEGAVGKGGEEVEVWYGYRGNEAAEHHAFVGNSTLAYDNGGANPHDTVTYAAIGLVQLTAQDPIVYLKLDTEGAEWAFLDSPALSRVETIVGEVHPTRGHKPADIIEMLQATHDVELEGENQEHGPCGFRAVRR